MTAPTSETGGGRVFRPGPRGALVAALAAAMAIVAVVVMAVSSDGNRPGSGRPAAHTRYGHLPSWLPNITNGGSALEVARPASPVLHEEQGYSVRAELPRGTANITAVGPQLPDWVASAVQSGRLSDDDSVPGRFIVTVIDARGTVPLRAGAFTILTDSGQIERPQVTVDGGGPLPAALRPGQHLNLAVAGAVAEGSGSIRWAPLGRRVLVGWIYQVELD